LLLLRQAHAVTTAKFAALATAVIKQQQAAKATAMQTGNMVELWCEGRTRKKIEQWWLL